MLPYYEGQFNRDNGALTSCQTASNRLALVGGDIMRRQDRGLGQGNNFFCEPTRTNFAKNTIFFPAPWAVANGATLVAQAAAGPDNYEGHLASRLTYPASSIAFIGQTLAVGVIPANTTLTFSVWAREAVGTGSFRFQVVDLDGVTRSSTIQTAGPFWQRFSYTVASGSNAAAAFPIRLVNGDATARQLFFIFPMIEASTEPSSYIHNDTTGNGVTAPDVLQFLPAQIPLQYRVGRTRGVFYCERSCANIVVNNDRCIIRSYLNGSNTLELANVGGNARLVARVNGVIVAESDNLALPEYGEGQYIVDPAAGTITVNGVTGPVGTPWAGDWPVGSVRIGGAVGGSGTEFRGEIAQEYAA